VIPEAGSITAAILLINLKFALEKDIPNYRERNLKAANIAEERH
jgi:hypothetical protein